MASVVRGEPWRGATVVVTGVTGQVAGAIAVDLARHNQVIGAARFRDPAARARLEAHGIRCVPIDLRAGAVADLPADADYVLHFAVAKTNRWADDLDANAGGTATLMEHHRAAGAFLHCSTTGVYKPMGHHVFAEGDPLGDNHGVWPFLATYSIAKIAAEAMARWAATRFELPTTIARLSVPYGDAGGWPAVHLHLLRQGTPVPVHLDQPSIYHPIHHDDIVASLPGLLAAASVPALTLNWGGHQAVSIEEWCTYLGELTGLPAKFAPTLDTIDSVAVDLTRLHDLVGPTQVDWKVGMRRMVEAMAPELLT